MASELHPWRFEVDFLCVCVQVSYPVATSHFAATLQSDVVRICAHNFQRHGDAFGTTENDCFRAFITLRSQFRLHHCSQRTLTEIDQKSLKPWTCPLKGHGLEHAQCIRLQIDIYSCNTCS